MSFQGSKEHIKSRSSLDENGCWIWKLDTRQRGYGKLKMDGKDILAHRASYQAFISPIPDGALVLHACDVPSCVNPEHLFLGTQKENIEDMVRKGRALSIGGGPPRLTEAQVKEIKAARASGEAVRAIARRYSLDPASIRLRLKGANKRFAKDK